MTSVKNRQSVHLKVNLPHGRMSVPLSSVKKIVVDTVTNHGQVILADEREYAITAEEAERFIFQSRLWRTPK